MARTDCVISVEFSDGTNVQLGGGGEVFVTVTDDAKAEGVTSATLNDDRLALIKRLQEAEDGEG